MTAAEFALLVAVKHRRGKWHDALCPAHDDHEPSLSFCDGDRALVVECRAGCPVESICHAVGLEVKDLFHDEAPVRALRVVATNGAPPREVATYDYVDARGNLLFQVVRYEPKSFRQRRPTGLGKWVWNMTGVERVVYRLDELSERQAVIWVEGEKDADTLAALGLTATTSPGGASAFDPKYAVQVAEAGGQDIIIIPDNDTPGRRYAQAVAAACDAAKMRVRVLTLPGVPAHGDTSDWIAAGGSVEALRQLWQKAPAWRPVATVVSDGLTVEAIGGEYHATWDTTGALLRFANVGPDRFGALSAEVYAQLSGMPPYWTRLTLASTSQRRELAKEFTERFPGHPWSEIIPLACLQVHDREEAGSPRHDVTTFAADDSTEWLIDNWIPLEGPTIVYGDGESFKSYLMLGLSIAAIHGDDLVDGDPAWAIHRRRSVLYLDWEEPSTKVADQRITALCRGRGLTRPPAGFSCKSMLGKSVAESVNVIRAEIAAIRAEMLVIDSLLPACGGNPSDPEVASRFFRALSLLGPVTILIVAHVAKAMAGGPDENGAMPTIFGSVFYRNLARSAIYVAADPTPNALDSRDHYERVLTLSNTKNNHANRLSNAPRALCFIYSGPRGARTMTITRGAAPNGHFLNPYEKIAHAVRSGAETVPEIRDQTGLSEGAVRSWLNRSPHFTCLNGNTGGRGKKTIWKLADTKRS